MHFVALAPGVAFGVNVTQVDTIFEVFSEHTPKGIDKLYKQVYNIAKRRLGEDVWW